jgi:hypothetical protein
MPEAQKSLRSNYKVITEGTRGLHYLLLNDTNSHLALIPLGQYTDLCSSCSIIPFEKLFSKEAKESLSDDTTFEIGSWTDVERMR